MREVDVNGNLEGDKIKKGQDRNPAHFKIQYPMKNHNNICNAHTSFMFIRVIKKELVFKWSGSVAYDAK